VGISLLVVVKALRIEVTLCSSNESSAVISLLRGILEILIPVQPENRTRPPIVDAYFLASDNLIVLLRLFYQ
jgi:hypothetical protein